MRSLQGLRTGRNAGKLKNAHTKDQVGLTFCSMHLIKSLCLECPTGCFRNSLRFSRRDSKAAGSDLTKGKSKDKEPRPSWILKQQSIIGHIHKERTQASGGCRVCSQLLRTGYKPGGQERGKQSQYIFFSGRLFPGDPGLGLSGTSAL